MYFGYKYKINNYRPDFFDNFNSNEENKTKIILLHNPNIRFANIMRNLLVPKLTD